MSENKPHVLRKQKNCFKTFLSKSSLCVAERIVLELPQIHYKKFNATKYRYVYGASANKVNKLVSIYWTEVISLLHFFFLANVK